MRRKNVAIPGFAHSAPVPAACRIGNIIVSGGFHGSDPVTGVVAPTMEEQTRNVFCHIKTAVEAAGGSVDDIIKVNAWLADTSDRSALNAEWTRMFSDPQRLPSRHVLPGIFAPGTYIVCDFMAVLEEEAA